MKVGEEQGHLWCGREPPKQRGTNHPLRYDDIHFLNGKLDLFHTTSDKCDFLVKVVFPEEERAPEVTRQNLHVH